MADIFLEIFLPLVFFITTLGTPVEFTNMFWHNVNIHFIVRTPPSFLKRGRSEKKGWKYGARVCLLKRGGGGWHCPYLIFSRFITFTFTNYCTLAKLCYAFEEKLFFSATIILWKKVILSCLKMNLKISHKLR